jgi:hypothetical protein
VTDRRDAVLLDLLEKIEKRGWALVGVFPTEESPGVPFTYTVGLTALGLPEFAMYGLNAQTAGALLNEIAGRARDGLLPPVGEPILDCLHGGLELTAIKMTDTSDLNSVRAVYGSLEEAHQIVWPDTAGRMPWAPGYDLAHEVQPLHGTH